MSPPQHREPALCTEPRRMSTRNNNNNNNANKRKLDADDEVIHQDEIECIQQKRNKQVSPQKRRPPATVATKPFQHNNSSHQNNKVLSDNENQPVKQEAATTIEESPKSQVAPSPPAAAQEEPVFVSLEPVPTEGGDGVLTHVTLVDIATSELTSSSDKQQQQQQLLQREAQHVVTTAQESPLSDDEEDLEEEGINQQKSSNKAVLNKTQFDVNFITKLIPSKYSPSDKRFDITEINKLRLLSHSYQNFAVKLLSRLFTEDEMLGKNVYGRNYNGQKTCNKEPLDAERVLFIKETVMCLTKTNNPELAWSSCVIAMNRKLVDVNNRLLKKSKAAAAPANKLQ